MKKFLLTLIFWLLLVAIIFVPIFYLPESMYMVHKATDKNVYEHWYEIYMGVFGYTVMFLAYHTLWRISEKISNWFLKTKEND